MVNRRGQMTTEFALVIGLLTLLGLILMNGMIGSDTTSGSVRAMQQNAVSKISTDHD